MRVAEIRALAASLGVALETQEFEWSATILADAPDGRQFCGTGMHGVVAEYAAGNRAERDAAWRSIAMDLQGGLEDCPEDCECREEEG